ncbi:MAG: hypothetical protein NT068_04220 [Candidatus Nomurabacteria bacterium]|nr:hypothetical protein [Candidatus Nomurabacteria bacterium]
MKILIIFLIIFLIILSFNFRNIKRIPKITYVRWLPKPRRGMTIPPFGIFVRKEVTEAWEEKHEDVHWAQYQKLGLFKFYFKYLYEFIKNGYFKNSFEIEARKKGGWKD